MDRSKLLEEFVTLERLLKEHDNKQARPTANNSNLSGKKCCHHLSRERIKSTIFFNPTKLNVINDCTTKVPEKLSNHTSKLSGKVFINPNFRKPDKLSSAEVQIKPPLNREEEKQKTRNEDHMNKSRTNSFQHGNNGSEKPSSGSFPQHRAISSNQGHKVAESTVAQKNTLNSNNRVIFINPQFSSTSKINPQLLNTTTRIVKERSTTVRQEFCNKNLDSDIKKSEQKLSMIVSQKRKIVTNDTLAKDLSTIDQKRSKRTENIAENVNKIFVNPNFEKKECHSNKTDPSNSESKLSVMNINCLVSSSRDNKTLNTRVSAIPVLLCGKEVPSKYTAVSYPLCAIVGPDRGKQIGKKTTAQRVRTRSTSLVTVSTTKLVRKRRSSQKVMETSGKTLPQPMYVSKTKLVRNVTKKDINNTCMAKIKLKQISQRTPAQIALTEKALKQKRKSFTDGSLNLISSTSRPSVVTKIRSKNGKSLKLIRKSADTMSLGLKAKTLNMINARKMELRKQASKAAVCLLQSRMKRNKFSKINVPVKVSHSPSYNINMYKKNNLVSRKPLTKSALLGTREAGSVIGKTQTRSMPLDMTKFIKSKYRLIRKQSSNTVSRYKLGQKVTNKISQQNRLALRKKLKWKQKNNTPKRKLTRKELSIKKIGGVFYRYSRTTLTRNKPPSKLVSQLQRKSISQFTPESRQNRFCLNKNVRRKRTSVSGSFITASSSGMTWRRSSTCSARSILTQAKQKSIHLLSKKLKKNNEPCLFFHRYGKCAGQERGTCVRLHDRKFVAVCKKFVAGQCSDDGCSLSHSPSCHNMPTCHHFLAGHCGRDHCPYPHIKVSDTAPVCLAFLNGYCPLGDQCSKRHFEICPSFEKGTCARGKYCPYPHPKNKSGEKLLGKFKHIKRKPLPSKEVESVSTPSLRYFEDVNLQNENKNHLDEDQEDHEDNNSEAEVEEVIRVKKRPQLGDLPSFIPLSRGEDT